MAVADVAVEMGPRNRRGITRGAVGLVVIGAIVTAVLLTRSPSPSGPVSSGSNTSSRSGASTGSGPVSASSLYPVTRKLVYGMTKQQVLHLDGRPNKILGDKTGLTCWQYAVNQTYHGFGRQSTLDNVRVCFEEGLYSIYHYEFDGKWADYSPPKISVP